MNCLTSLSSPALGTQQANPFELYMPQTVDLIGKKKSYSRSRSRKRPPRELRKVVAQEPAAKWKKWWLKRSISKDATFWQK